MDTRDNTIMVEFLKPPTTIFGRATVAIAAVRYWMADNPVVSRFEITEIFNALLAHYPLQDLMETLQEVWDRAQPGTTSLIGPPLTSLEPCMARPDADTCSDDCPWCLGTGLLTPHVAKLQKRELEKPEIQPFTWLPEGGSEEEVTYWVTETKLNAANCRVQYPDYDSAKDAIRNIYGDPIGSYIHFLTVEHRLPRHGSDKEDK